MVHVETKEIAVVTMSMPRIQAIDLVELASQHLTESFEKCPNTLDFAQRYDALSEVLRTLREHLQVQCEDN